MPPRQRRRRIGARVLPGFAPIVVIFEQPVEALFHPAAQAIKAATARHAGLTAPARNAGLTAAAHTAGFTAAGRWPGAGSTTRHPIDELTARAHPAIESLIQRLTLATGGAARLAAAKLGSVVAAVGGVVVHGATIPRLGGKIGSGS